MDRTASTQYFHVSPVQLAAGTELVPGEELNRSNFDYDAFGGESWHNTKVWFADSLDVIEDVREYIADGIWDATGSRPADDQFHVYLVSPTGEVERTDVPGEFYSTGAVVLGEVAP